jgi:hypothetical protein
MVSCGPLLSSLVDLMVYVGINGIGIRRRRVRLPPEQSPTDEPARQGAAERANKERENDGQHHSSPAEAPRKTVVVDGSHALDVAGHQLDLGG